MEQKWQEGTLGVSRFGGGRISEELLCRTLVKGRYSMENNEKFSQQVNDGLIKNSYSLKNKLANSFKWLCCRNFLLQISMTTAIVSQYFRKMAVSKLSSQRVAKEVILILDMTKGWC